MGEQKRLNTLIAIELKNAGISQSKFARNYGIPIRTVQNWCLGTTTPSPWVVPWIIEKIHAMKGS